MNNLEAKIEAVLFWKGEPMSLKKLGEVLKVEQSEVKDALFNLKNNLAGRGIALVQNDDEVTFGTAPEFSKLIESLQKEELNKSLSKASLETLSIILYKNGVSRSEIDYIRGVNSSFILRALSVRGLVEKKNDPKDNRRFVYLPSFELLSYLGVKSISELPEYDEVNATLSAASQNIEEDLKQTEKQESLELPQA